jgi:hypothetical protein
MPQLDQIFPKPLSSTLGSCEQLCAPLLVP